MKNKNIYGIIILTVGISIYLYVNTLTLSKELKRTRQLLKTSEKKVNDYQKLQFYNWSVNFDSLENLSITDKNQKTHKLFDLINNESAIFYIHNTMCMMCVEKELENLNTVAKIIGKENIIVLAKGFSPKFLYKSDKFKNWWHNLYQTKSAPTLENKNLSGTPNIILVNKSYEILNSYHALKHNTNSNFKLFLHTLKQKYHDS